MLEKLDTSSIRPSAAAPYDWDHLVQEDRVHRLIYASCNPASFARDARILVDGGWRLTTVRPIDQFLYAHEIELVARLVRD